MTFATQQCINLSVTDAFRNSRRIARGRKRSQKRRDEQVSESVTRVRQGFGLLWAIPSFFDSTPYWAPSHHCTLVVAAYPIEDIFPFLSWYRMQLHRNQSETRIMPTLLIFAKIPSSISLIPQELLIFYLCSLTNQLLFHVKIAYTHIL